MQQIWRSDHRYDFHNMPARHMNFSPSMFMLESMIIFIKFNCCIFFARVNAFCYKMHIHKNMNKPCSSELNLNWLNNRIIKISKNQNLASIMKRIRLKLKWIIKSFSSVLWSVGVVVKFTKNRIVDEMMH